jgi:hypothetical protein
VKHILRGDFPWISQDLFIFGKFVDLLLQTFLLVFGSSSKLRF